MNFVDTILLTGAGFTANFGGFLAKEMWSKIYNNPKLNSAGNVKLELRKNFDFEDVYSKVIDGRPPFQPGEATLLEEVMSEAYILMDEVVKQPGRVDSSGVHPADLRRFLEYFTQTTTHESGACFTLNQDLFLERQIGWQPLGPATMRFKGDFGNLDWKDLDSGTPKHLPPQGELEDFISHLSEGFAFVKLHGSLRWASSDGKDTKIIGINKRESIEKIPLLKWYFGLFEQALFRHGVKLVVVGYGFRDKHINACIVKAIRENGLKLYVVSPESPDDFRFRMTFKHSRYAMMNEPDDEGSIIWSAVEGYFPYSLREIFPISQGKSAAKVELYNAIGMPLVT